MGREDFFIPGSLHADLGRIEVRRGEEGKGRGRVGRRRGGAGQGRSEYGGGAGGVGQGGVGKGVAGQGMAGQSQGWGGWGGAGWGRVGWGRVWQGMAWLARGQGPADISRIGRADVPQRDEASVHSIPCCTPANSSQLCWKPNRNEPCLLESTLGVLAESEVTKIFQLALGNESPSPVEHKTVLHSGIELIMMISEGFKVSDFGGGPDHKSSKFYLSSRYRRPEIF